MTTPLVLCVDCAAPVVGLSIGPADGLGPPWARWSSRVSRGADGLLAPELEAQLALAARRGGALQRVAVTIGPGTFTGLRVGLATALGVAVALDLPVVPLCSLAARAAMVAGGGPVLALLDARKGRFYGACFEGPDAALQLAEPRDAELADLLPAGPFVAVGEGAVVAAERLRAAGGRVAPDADAPPLEAMARLAAHLPGIDAALVELAYIRPPDAQVPRHLPTAGGAR